MDDGYGKGRCLMANGGWWIAAWVILAAALALIDGLIQAALTLTRGEEKEAPAAGREWGVDWGRGPDRTFVSVVDLSGRKQAGLSGFEASTRKLEAQMLKTLFGIKKLIVAEAYGDRTRMCLEHRRDLAWDTWERVQLGDRRCSMTLRQLETWSERCEDFGQIRGRN